MNNVLYYSTYNIKRTDEILKAFETMSGSARNIRKEICHQRSHLYTIVFCIEKSSMNKIDTI